MSQGYTCAKGRALPVMHHHPGRIVRPLLRAGDPSCSGGAGAARLLGSTALMISPPGCAASSTATARRRSASSSAVGSAWTRPVWTAGARHAIGTPARMSPLTIDGTAKTVTAALVGGFPG